MLSYVFMKILERRPRSYDQTMDKVSRGRVRKLKQAIVDEIPAGARVLEIGCGTGELAEMLVDKGAMVEGFDLSPSMVRTAQERIAARNLEDRFSARLMGVDGMDGLASDTYDAVCSTLVFSELTDDERRFALKHAARALKQGGLLVIADEVVPRNAVRRFIHSLLRAPLVIITYLVSTASTSPLKDLPGDMTAAGFVVEKEIKSRGGSTAIVVGSLQSSSDNGSPGLIRR
jgi:cyclopropane fatty-acyl-phospholipid synthase-like methyltransferase